MSRRPFCLLALGAALLAVSFHPAAAATTDYPATSALENDLQQTTARLGSLSARTRRALQATQDARAKVKQVSSIVDSVRKIDETIIRLIRQLKPVSKLPPTRMLGTLVKGLEKLQVQVHKVRVKGDRTQKEVLSPLDAKLRVAEAKLRTTIGSIDSLASDANRARQHTEQLHQFVVSRGSRRAEVAVLESLATSARTSLRPLGTTLTELDTASAAVEGDLRELVRRLAPATGAGAAVQKLQQDLTPVSSTATKLDKVLDQYIGVKVLGKSYGFTVRKVIEGPGKVADAVLKPLQKLAEKALAPVLKGVKFEIQAPRALTEFASQLDGITDNFTKSYSDLNAVVTKNGLANGSKSMTGLLAKSTRQLAVAN